MILFDTDVCIEILRGNKNIMKKREKESSPVGISFITAGELFYGAYKSGNVDSNLTLIDRFLMSVRIIQSNYEIMKNFGNLKAELSLKGNMLPDADIMIAATAISKCTKLITGNIEHFRRFDELKIENWLK